MLRALVPDATLALLDHDTLFTAKWEMEELRRFAVLDALPTAAPPLSAGHHGS